MIVMIKNLLIIVILSSAAAFKPVSRQHNHAHLAGPWSGGLDFIFGFGVPDFSGFQKKEQEGTFKEDSKRPPLRGVAPNTKLTGSPNELLSIGSLGSNCQGRAPLSVHYNKYNISTLSGVEVPQHELSVRYGDTLICPATFTTSDKTRSVPTQVSFPAEVNQLYTLMLVDLYIDENLEANISRSDRCFQDQMGIAGGNIRNVDNVMSAGACRDLCQQEERCDAWTYRQATYPRAQYRNTCALKDNTRKEAKPFNNVVSGPRDCPDRHYLHYMKSNIPGDDLTSGDVIFQYLPPAVPSSGNPPKPLVFFVYQQREPIYNSFQGAACSAEDIFSASRISPTLIPNLVEKYNLGSAPVAGNFFLLDEFVPEVDNEIWCYYENCTGQCIPYTGCRCDN